MRDANALAQQLQEFADPNGDASHDARNRHVGGDGNSVAERYLEARLSIHLHIATGAFHNGVPGDFCLAFERAQVFRDKDKSAGLLGRLELDNAFVRKGTDDMQRSVPVVARQFVQVPERVIGEGTVQSLERLLPLNKCLLLVRDSANSLNDSGSQTARIRVSKGIFVPENWELGIVTDGLMIKFREYAGHMVQGGTQVVKDFADQDTDAWWRLFLDSGLDQEIIRLGLEIQKNTVRITGEEYLVQIAEFFGSIQTSFKFGDHSRKRVIHHEVSSNYERQPVGSAETDNQAGIRDSHSYAWRVPGQSQEDGQEAAPLNYPQPEEVASRTSRARRGGANNATRTRSGTPEDE